MHWILQNNLFNEEAYQVLLDTLERFELPYSIHKVIPFVGELVPVPSLETKNVICMGSYSLRHSAKKFGWYPGVFDLDCYHAKERIAWWRPAAAFVIDVADTPEGMKIVETNTLNSCGFYAADIQKLVMALEEGFSE